MYKEIQFVLEAVDKGDGRRDDNANAEVEEWCRYLVERLDVIYLCLRFVRLSARLLGVLEMQCRVGVGACRSGSTDAADATDS